MTTHEAKWRWWERWTLVVDFPLGQWRVAPRGWFTRGTATIEAAMGEMHSLVYPAGHRGHVTVVRTRDVLKGDASADGGQADTVCGHVEVYVNHGNETVGPFRCTRPAGHPDAHSDGRIGWYGGSVNGGRADA